MSVGKQGKHRYAGTSSEQGAGGGCGGGEKTRSKLDGVGEEQTGWSGKNEDGGDRPGATQPSKLCSANQEQEEEKEQIQLSTNGEKRAQFAEQVGTRTTSGPSE